VASAKSWLCHPGVDRRAPLLPADAPPEVERISPLAASTRYLQHLRQAWDAAHPGAPFDQQDITVTISRILRPGRARADGRGLPRRRLPAADPAGRTPGSPLQLDKGQRRRLAQAGQRWAT